MVIGRSFILIFNPPSYWWAIVIDVVAAYSWFYLLGNPKTPGNIRESRRDAKKVIERE